MSDAPVAQSEPFDQAEPDTLHTERVSAGICDTCHRYLTIGEVLNVACSTCEPAKFADRCTKCGTRCPGGACDKHAYKKRGERLA